MRRRLYFVLPDVASAEQTLHDLLLARIEVSHIHCLARRDLPMGEGGTDRYPSRRARRASCFHRARIELS